jgi:hypothetical protein
VLDFEPTYRMTKPDEQEAVSHLAQAAQPVPPPHAAELRGTAKPPLSGLHSRTVALMFPAPDKERLLVGVAEYVADPDLGPVLRVFVHDVADLEVLIAESAFQGQVVSGQAHGCDYLIHLGMQGTAPSSQPGAPARERQS